ncbi:MAG: polysaccharide deacetylase family protein [Rikenellaceae bacterium]
MYINPPKFIRKIFPTLIWELESDDSVFLTFDDGPTPGVTEYVLEQLAKYDAKATFFCLGKNAEMYPELFEAIKKEGHKIGNHTYSHQKGWNMSLERYLQDVDLANDILCSDLFRPPYARIRAVQSKRLAERYNLIMWDILSQDYNSLVSPKKCLRNVTKHVKAGSIVVFHDSQKAFRNMSYALPRSLEYIKEIGLKCTTIDI